MSNGQVREFILRATSKIRKTLTCCCESPRSNGCLQLSSFPWWYTRKLLSATLCTPFDTLYLNCDTRIARKLTWIYPQRWTFTGDRLMPSLITICRRHDCTLCRPLAEATDWRKGNTNPRYDTAQGNAPAFCSFFLDNTLSLCEIPIGSTS